VARGLDELIRQAKLVLEFNWTGEYTKPGPRLYPHQWSWDAAFIAIGYARFDQERAISGLRHLFAAQWANGLLPQIVFDPEYADSYSPGVDLWQAQRSPHASQDALTSGVVQPPLHATAVLHVHRHAQDRDAARAFLEEAFPHLRAWHRYLHTERDPGGDGLAYIRHPWESGMDNSPMWDSIMQRMQLSEGDIPDYERADIRFATEADRPVQAQYDRFAHLVRLFAERDYDEARIREDCPFLVWDVLFNSLLCQADRDLAEIASEIGDDRAPFERDAEATHAAIDERLWDADHGLYLDRDLAAGQPLHAYAAAGFTPLFAGIPDAQRARSMIEALQGAGFGVGRAGVKAVPSYDRHGFGFSPVEYWRGPVWINIDWLLVQGLRRYGFDEQADELRRTIVELVGDQGFFEYFEPDSGKAHGSHMFSWSAALFLDVALE
jgi:glycogen debranching enzyme